MTAAANPAGAVDARAHRRAAEGQLGQPRQRRTPAARCPSSPGRVPAELLAQGDRRRVHQVRAAAFTTPSNSSRFASERVARCVERGEEVVDHAIGRGQVDRRREDVVARLAGVHVVVGVDRPPQSLRRRGSRSPRWRSCSTRCRSRSGTRRSGTGRPSRRPSPPRRPRGWPRPRRRRATPSSALTLRGRGLDQAEGMDHRRSMRRPLIGKFSTARWVWRPTGRRRERGPRPSSRARPGRRSSVIGLKSCARSMSTKRMTGGIRYGSRPLLRSSRMSWHLATSSVRTSPWCVGSYSELRKSLAQLVARPAALRRWRCRSPAATWMRPW